MFGAKYSRLKFWIISICLLVPDSILMTFAKAFERAENYNNANTLYIIIFIIALIWINTLANRMRDHGSNPWFSLFAFIPLINIILALYYGISKSAIKEDVVESSNDTNSSLAQAVYNHSKDVASGIKPAIEEYKQKHSNQNSNIDDDQAYEQALTEIEEDKKVKSTWAKALAQSEGNKDKAESLYINNRVENIKSEYKTVQVIEKETSNEKEKYINLTSTECEIKLLKNKKSNGTITTFENSRLEWLINYERNKTKESEKESALEKFIQNNKITKSTKINEFKYRVSWSNDLIESFIIYENKSWKFSEIDLTEEIKLHYTCIGNNKYRKNGTDDIYVVVDGKLKNTTNTH